MGEINPVYGLKLSSVGPATPTRHGVIHELTNMDLVMKLHYLRVVYFYKKTSVEGLKILEIKETMFRWLNHYYINCGRLGRKSDTGRPFVKCHDCGVRFIEAKCKIDMDEWLVKKNDNQHLVSNQVLGDPELGFSPPVLIQLTLFKCGGMSVGLSWAHVLGDAFSASDFINMWGHVMTAHPIPAHPLKPQTQTQTQTPVLKDPNTHFPEPLAIKRVDPVGDYWKSTANTCKMGTYSFQINAAKLEEIQFKIMGKRPVPSFVALSALLWHSVAKTSSKELEPKIITVCKRGSCNKRNEYSGNNQIISTVKVDESILDVDIIKLTELIIYQGVQENNQIEQVAEKDEGLSDFIMYGTNLTFVDLEAADVYGLVLKDEHKPVLVNYAVDGIGDKGMVLVNLGPSHGGRTVTVILPEDQVLQLKTELQREWCIT